jgi:sugar/nucleoside kinase (ribokinase family)
VSGGARFELTTLGEAMVQLAASTAGPLRQVRSYDVHPAGSELNVAIGAARMGLAVSWIGALGDDGFGDLLLSAARADAVDTSGVVRIPQAPTGVFFVQRGYPADGLSSSIYYRAGSAGSQLSEAHLAGDHLARTDTFHTSGISLAVSPELANAARAAAAAAEAAGARCSFDVNFRAKLWSAQEARPAVEGALERSHVAFCSLEDAGALWAVEQPEDAVELLAGFGPAHAIVSCGADGAVMLAGGRLTRAESPPIRVLDATGAGDAFCATVLTGIARGWPAETLLRRACVAGAIVCGVIGDNVGTPTLEELERAATDNWVYR